MASPGAATVRRRPALLVALCAAAQAAAGSPRCSFVGGTASAAAVLRDQGPVERSITVRLWDAHFDPSSLSVSEGAAALSGSLYGVPSAWDALRADALPNASNFVFGSTSWNGTADAEYDLLTFNLSAAPTYFIPRAEELQATLPGSIIFGLAPVNLTCDNLWEIAADAAVPPVRCAFVGGTATSVSVFRDPGAAERTIVLRLWNAAFAEEALWGSAALFDALLAGITGSYPAVTTAWDAVKGEALPDPGAVAFQASSTSTVNGTTLPGPVDLMVLNLSAVVRYSAPGTEVLNATLPAGMLLGHSENLTCANAWEIAALSADHAALWALFDSLGGDGWTRSDGWLDSEADLCSWHGIQCAFSADFQASTFGRVTGVYLGSNNLQGAIPPELEGMERLTHLHLEGNAINGTLPEFLGTLEDLEVISLPENKLVGTVPWQWHRLPRLRQVLLYRNQLTGTIPHEWGNMTNITTVLLHQNDLEGSLPAWGRPGDPARLPSLRKLWAYGNPRFQELNPDNDQTSWEDARFPHSLAKHGPMGG